MGAALPWGQGGRARGTRRCGERRKRRGQESAGLLGRKGLPQSGNEPWGGAFRENGRGAPQHASDLINPLGKDREAAGGPTAVNSRN